MWTSTSSCLRALCTFSLVAILSACGDGSPSSPPPATILPTASASATEDTSAGGPTANLVTVIPNLAYSNRSPSQALDVYLPTTGKKPYPVVLWIHGGAWINGTRKFPTNAPHFALLNSGIALVSMSHRTSAEARYPAQIQDAKAAVRWIRANAKKYNLDSSRVGVWGASSGGHLGALLGSSYGVAALTDLTLGNPTMSDRVKAIVTMYAPFDFLQLDAQNKINKCPPFGGTGFNAASSPTSQLMGAPIQTVPTKVKTANPGTYETVGDAPLLIQHGTADCSIPWQQAGLIATRATAVLGASKVSLQYFQGYGHASQIFTSPTNIAKIVQFFKTNL